LLLLIPAETNVWDTSFGLTTYKFIWYKFIGNRKVGSPKKQWKNQIRTTMNKALFCLKCADNYNEDSDDVSQQIQIFHFMESQKFCCILRGPINRQHISLHFCKWITVGRMACVTDIIRPIMNMIQLEAHQISSF
jgi:hypothetical protein